MATMARARMRTRNLAVSIVLLALAPQIFAVIWSVGTIFGWSSGSGPFAVLAGHAAALLAEAPAAALRSLGAGSLAAMSYDAQLALIYSYPLFAIAIVTIFMTIRSTQEYVGGVVLIAVALFALWASADLQGMQGFSFGAGTAPRMLAWILLGLSAAIALTGLVSEGPALAFYAWRGPLFVMTAILVFALSIRPLGLLVAGFGSFMIAAVGTSETRWSESLVVGTCLTLGCALLFPYVLGLPMPMLPRFLAQ